MRTLSRHLLPAPKVETTIWQKIIGAVLVCVLLAFLAAPVMLLRASSPNFWLFILFASVVVPAWMLTACRSQTMFQKMMSARATENICSFRRAFDLRQVDPWIVRVVHEEVLNWLNSGKTNCAIRAEDRLVDDLFIDPEDVEGLAATIAHRAGYDFRELPKNPLFGKVFTVGELVMFFTHQRKIRV